MRATNGTRRSREPAGPLYSWGRFVHRHRRAVLAASLLFFAGTIALLVVGAELAPYEPPTTTESGRALQLMEDELPVSPDAVFFLILSHPTLAHDDPAFRDAVDAALAPMRANEHVIYVRTPYEASPDLAQSMVSRDGHRVLVVAAVDGNEEVAREHYSEVRAATRSDVLSIVATGQAAIHLDIESTLDSDLKQAETVSLPFTLILLVIVFGTLAAALLPLGVGIMAVSGGVALTFGLAHFMDVSVYATNVVTLLGLGVAIDYSLFIVTRFREELAGGHTVEDALGRTLATAGRAVAFSGLTVAVGLSALAFYKGLFVFTMGIAGAIVVTVAVLYALALLPALLSMLGPRVNRLRVPFMHPERASTGSGFWHALASGVMKRPVMVLVPALALILLMGAPLLSLEAAGGGPHALPQGAESRQGFELVSSAFPNQGATTVHVLVEFTGDPLAPSRVGPLYDFGQRLARVPGVVGAQSVVNLDAGMTRDDYVALYGAPRSGWPAPARELATQTVGAHIVQLTAYANLDPTSDAAREVVDAVRALASPPGGELLVTGQAAIDRDQIQLIGERTPWAVLYIVSATYLLILLQTRSILLPLKAVLMNSLSIIAAFGLVVWIFQLGHGSGVLDFTPGPIDPGTLILLFANMFGLSMDYEVLMLSRMHEEYRRTGDNRAAVAQGLEKTGRLITSAAAIMVLVFGAFAMGHVVFIKAFGLGLALAIAIDATIVRGLIVPAAMRLMGRWNWWAPAWMRPAHGPARAPRVVANVRGRPLGRPAGGPWSVNGWVPGVGVRTEANGTGSDGSVRPGVPRALSIRSDTGSRGGSSVVPTSPARHDP